ncbi:MAG: hypothetical protein HC879_21365 [Leptolyngbyaceae cyanobacterium SL_5_9]|nr:hypothetical protein [Leptolyngbyaceae cyanobacterium SL_5_9]NJO76871.1 hypothetical protein [Leptolyngbyaceae cyanobacterium RM1_406_9]
MQSLNIDLPKSVADALTAYTTDRGISSPTEVVQTALEEFLLQQGYLAQKRSSLRLTPASQGSGFRDTSVNHDQVLAEQVQMQKLPKQST